MAARVSASLCFESGNDGCKHREEFHDHQNNPVIGLQPLLHHHVLGISMSSPNHLVAFPMPFGGCHFIRLQEREVGSLHLHNKWKAFPMMSRRVRSERRTEAFHMLVFIPTLIPCDVLRMNCGFYLFFLSLPLPVIVAIISWSPFPCMHACIKVLWHESSSLPSHTWPT